MPDLTDSIDASKRRNEKVNTVDEGMRRIINTLSAIVRTTREEPPPNMSSEMTRFLSQAVRIER